MYQKPNNEDWSSQAKVNAGKQENGQQMLSDFVGCRGAHCASPDADRSIHFLGR